MSHRQFFQSPRFRVVRRPAALLAAILAGIAVVTPIHVAAADPGATPTDRPRVFPDAEAVQPLGVGASAPSVTVRTIDGETVDLATLTRDRGALLVFYRGGW